ncbi:MAG: carboxylesterase family protein, partial [Mycobacterium sp.]
PTTPANIDRYLAQLAPDERQRVLAAYHRYPRRRACQAIGADAMFVAPTWAFADAYSAHAPTHVYRFDHASSTLRAAGLGATHGSEIVHILHTYGSHLGRRLHPLGRWRTPAVGRRMQRTWLGFAGAGQSSGRSFAQEWPCYDTQRRATRIIRSDADVVVDDPDVKRRTAWQRIL